MRRCVACLGLAATALVGPRPVLADVWDTTGDDAAGTTRNELVHGADQVHDLAARPGPVADVDWYRLSQQGFSSYEIVVDAASGDVGPSGPALDRIAADGATVLQSSVSAGAGASRTLSFENATAGAVNDQRIRVRSNGCSSGCGSDNTYRIRALDTTGVISRFNNSGTQITIIILQNTGTGPLDGHLSFWSQAGLLLASPPFTVPGRGSMVVNSGGILPNASGSVTVSNTGAYGQLSGRATSVEPATGFTFDTLMVTRPMSAQGSAGGRGSAALVITPSSGDFGAWFLGGTHTIPFTVRNIGAIPSGVLATTLSGPDVAQFSVSADTCAGTSLGAGASCTLQGHFMPASLGPKSAFLAVTGTPGGAASAPLVGSGIGGNPVFVTSTTHTPDLGGLPAADAICQARAAAGGLPPGNYVAWLSTLTVDARTRLGSARGFVRTDGQPFADTVTSFCDNSAVLNTILTDESGNTVGGGDDVWTGTLIAGTVGTLTCADWTSANPSLFGTAGTVQGGPASWTQYSFPSCGTPNHLYCFRTDLNVPITIPPASDRLAFVTNGTFTPGGGLAAADDFCGVETCGSLPCPVKAYLATTAGSAASHVNLVTSPYMRFDMTRVGGAAEVGTASPLKSGVWQHQGGIYVSQTILNNRAAWTGSFAPDAVGTAATTCNDWTSTSGTAYVGDPTLVSPQWFARAAGQDCSLPRRLYCLMD